MAALSFPGTSENSILHAKGRTHHWEGHGALSIKTFTGGKAFYKTHHGYFAVEEPSYLLLNEGHYAISIESDAEVESFCLFFEEGFAEKVSSSLNRTSKSLIEDPYRPPAAPVEFFEKTYPNQPYFTRLLHQLKKQAHLFEQDPLWKEEQFHCIMQAVLADQQKVIKEVESLPALRFSTREEIYRRLILAHDYIVACYNRSLTLEDMASVACMSANHLLRNYKILYGKTPHQQITEKRLDEAKRMLAANKSTMTEIALHIGFETPAAFNKMFKKHTGLSPSQFQKSEIGKA
ncbi:MAG TPA: AraC family transcriptional regulator [Bacillales bacterium]|nr:AraC family transcriptional regulator [Bacillales bacterium]